VEVADVERYTWPLDPLGRVAAAGRSTVTELKVMPVFGSMLEVAATDG
jgi:hypothetical protein